MTVPDDIHDHLQRYARSLLRGADDDDPERRDVKTANRYINDLKWYDEWLTANGMDPTEVSKLDAEDLGYDLVDEFNGTTPKNRWRVIYNLHKYLVNVDIAAENPLEPWHDDIRTKFGMSNEPEQDKHLEDGETYAVSQDEVRQMEQHVPGHTIRNQLLIRGLWQFGCRKGEIRGVEIDHIDRDEREVHLPGSITKNGDPRTVVFQPSLDGLLRQWLDDGYRARFAHSTDSPYLFITERSPQISESAIEDIVAEAATNAGLNRVLYPDAQGNERRKITPHNIRHGFGDYMVHETDATLYEVSKLMGHKSVKVTQQRYLSENPEAGVEAGHEYGPE